MFMLTANESILRAARKSDEMLEPYEWKRSCTVLRRERAGNRPDLADYAPLVNRLGGQVVKISPTSRDFVNPMDLNMFLRMGLRPLVINTAGFWDIPFTPEMNMTAGHSRHFMINGYPIIRK